MIKIMIADDQELIRESLKIILSTKEEFKVIATVGSGKEVIGIIGHTQGVNKANNPPRNPVTKTYNKDLSS